MLVTTALPSFETNAAEKVNSPLKASDWIKEPPRRIPVVDKADVVVVGGRCFGFERPLTFDAREIGVCFLTGQASRTTAALCADRRCSSRELDIKDLQRQNKGDNVRFS